MNILAAGKRLHRRYGFAIRQKSVLESTLGNLQEVNAALPIHYRIAKAADIDALTLSDHDYDTEAKSFAKERLAQGDQMIVGINEGEIVFYGWLMFGAMDLGYRQYRRLSPCRVYIYKLFTVSRHRGQRILPGFYTFIKPMLLTRGYERIMCWVQTCNISSLKSHERSGFVPVGKIYEIRFLDHRWYCLSAGLHQHLMTRID